MNIKKSKVLVSAIALIGGALASNAEHEAGSPILKD